MRGEAKQLKKVVIRRKITKLLKGIRSTDVSLSSKEMKSTGEGGDDICFPSCSSATDELAQKPDNSNIAEAELTLRERGSLNYEEARALLGRIEFQKGNIEAALQVFEGIDIPTVMPKIISALENFKRQTFHSSPLSLQCATLLLEAVFLKAKSLQFLSRFKEAAESCKVIADIIESSFPEGIPESFQQKSSSPQLEF